ncbi:MULTISPECIES: hypothetical protein [unclassified Comamonas]|uniref:hypothetical protein n=1 Tax=unclassified Comamonas TaxID=2638500 RepID=UPI001FA6E2BB|nr:MULTISPECIES: hypothetical protein [unclassified Comamonas]UNV91842.1 hypothetical protein MP576_05660 [Comamonas sp. 7D-2evo1]UNV94856.1 hypothetical protein MPZ60_20680 [Comamonas sp. 7D-2]UNW01480.1 hypothetical protein MP579_05645 [Comamonas sp. 7D-2evo2]
MRKYTTRHQVRHGGKRLPIGSTLELSDKDAEDLGDAVVLQPTSSGEHQASTLIEEKLKIAVIDRERAEARVEAAKSELLELRTRLEAEVRAREEAAARAEAEAKSRAEAEARADAAEKALADASTRATAAEKALADSASAADGKGGKGKTLPLA